MIVRLIFWYVLCLAAGAVVFPVMVKTMTKGGHVRINFRGRYIPTSLGIAYALLTIVMLLGVSFWKAGIADRVAPMAIIVIGFALLGLLDDTMQTREKGGFRGHLSRMGSEGEISTALLKMFFGGALSLLVALLYWRDQGIMAIADAIIVALSANMINLLDVRPGRAVKGFSTAVLFILIGSVIGSFFGKSGILPVTWFLIGPFAVWTLIYAPIDFRCRGMLGDSGSNVLGAVMGLLIVWELNATNRWVALGLLFGFHLFSEAVSLTALIEKISPLRWLDKLGVKPD
ncbi:MAG: hypothetical protein WCX65_18105 [bacterium]